MKSQLRWSVSDQVGTRTPRASTLGHVPFEIPLLRQCRCHVCGQMYKHEVQLRGQARKSHLATVDSQWHWQPMCLMTGECTQGKERKESRTEPQDMIPLEGVREKRKQGKAKERPRGARKTCRAWPSRVLQGSGFTDEEAMPKAADSAQKC